VVIMTDVTDRVGNATQREGLRRPAPPLEVERTIGWCMTARRNARD
jgi:hypothetical protein